MNKRHSNLMSVGLEESVNKSIDITQFETLGINLIAGPSYTDFECRICRERWKADLNRTMDGYWMQLVLPTMEERFIAPYLCPNGCNKNI